MGGVPPWSWHYRLLGPGAPPARKRRTMRPRLIAAVTSAAVTLAVVAGMGSLNLRPGHAGEQPSASGYKVLEPIRHGSLTAVPIVAPQSYATGEFLTLDGGLRSGAVVVTEYGNV